MMTERPTVAHTIVLLFYCSIVYITSLTFHSVYDAENDYDIINKKLWSLTQVKHIWRLREFVPRSVEDKLPRVVRKGNSNQQCDRPTKTLLQNKRWGRVLSYITAILYIFLQEDGRHVSENKSLSGLQFVFIWLQSSSHWRWSRWQWSIVNDRLLSKLL